MVFTCVQAMEAICTFCGDGLSGWMRGSRKRVLRLQGCCRRGGRDLGAIG